jgi:hypothetical protein
MSNHSKYKLSEILLIDDDTDTVTIYGRKFDGDLLRGLAMVFPVGMSFTVVSRDDGTVCVEQIQ